MKPYPLREDFIVLSDYPVKGNKNNYAINRSKHRFLSSFIIVLLSFSFFTTTAKPSARPLENKKYRAKKRKRKGGKKTKLRCLLAALMRKVFCSQRTRALRAELNFDTASPGLGLQISIFIADPTNQFVAINWFPVCG